MLLDLGRSGAGARIGAGHEIDQVDQLSELGDVGQGAPNDLLVAAELWLVVAEKSVDGDAGTVNVDGGGLGDAGADFRGHEAQGAAAFDALVFFKDGDAKVDDGDEACVASEEQVVGLEVAMDGHAGPTVDVLEGVRELPNELAHFAELVAMEYAWLDRCAVNSLSDNLSHVDI